MRYAILENSICVNVIIAEDDFAAEIGAVTIPDEFGIGDIYSDGKWAKGSVAVPEVMPTAEDDLAALLVDLEYRTVLLELNSEDAEV